FVVTDFLHEHFPEIVDTGFTVRMEEDLDRIAAGEVEWVPVVRDFFEPFSKLVEEKTKSVKKSDVTEEATDRICPKCGRPVVIKLGRYGRFYSCTGFKKGKKGEPLPEGACDYSEPLEGQKEPQLEILEGEICPECGKPLARRRGRFGALVGCVQVLRKRLVGGLDMAYAPRGPLVEDERLPGAIVALRKAIGRGMTVSLLCDPEAAESDALAKALEAEGIRRSPVYVQPR